MHDQENSNYFKFYSYEPWQKKVFNLLFLWFWLNLIGFPPSLSFMGKFDLILALLQEQKYLSLFGFGLTIIACVIYAIKLLTAMLVWTDEDDLSNIDSRQNTQICQFGLIRFVWVLISLLILAVALAFFAIILR
jgi:NADH:ubiquinone oxidoreductase subunit 2 (subunit N)